MLFDGGTMSVHHIPAGYHTVTPYLVVRGGEAALEFYKKAFGASEIMRIPMPGGRVAHAEIQIAESRIMLGDESPDCGSLSPESVGGTPVGINLYVPNADETGRKFIEAGGKSLTPIENQFYGDRSGQFLDPFGHKWTISTHVEDVSEEELNKRMEKLFGGAKG